MHVCSPTISFNGSTYYSSGSTAVRNGSGTLTVKPNWEDMWNYFRRGYAIDVTLLAYDDSVLATFKDAFKYLDNDPSEGCHPGSLYGGSGNSPFSRSISSYPAIAGVSIQVYTLPTETGGHESRDSGYWVLEESFGYRLNITNPTAPTAVNAPAYVKQNQSAALSWSGATGGGNNSIAKYIVYKNGQQYTETTATSIGITGNAVLGASDIYTVKTIGNYNKESAISNGATVTTYGDPTSPQTATVTKSSPQSGEQIMISFSNAANGVNNPIKGYSLYESTSQSGPFTKKLSITTRSLSGSFTFNADQSGRKFYTVVAEGDRSNAHTYSPIITVTINNHPSVPSIKIGGIGQEITTTGTVVETAVESPKIRVYCYDVDTYQDLTLLCRINSGNWQTVKTAKAGYFATVRLETEGTYEFKVRDDAGDESGVSGVVYTKVPYTYTDNPVIAGQTRIKAVHINEIRTMLEQMAVFYGLNTPNWAETVEAGTTSTRNANAHIGEIRGIINNIYDTMLANHLEGNAPVFSADIAGMQVKADALNELITQLKRI